ncbi:hypothetical protein BX600DRAFT_517861 [Xylariales sp. PMI_506]|nr:hypothetical protein BX600DRAFT_517861 [Xylariales sp. PMI_506]
MGKISGGGPSTQSTSTPRSASKRKLPQDWETASSYSPTLALGQGSSNGVTYSEGQLYARDTDVKKKSKKAENSKSAKTEEKRLRRFRPRPPTSFQEIYSRATSQRFYVLGRSRRGTPQSPEEIVDLTGSTGNIYQVHISRQPTCSCPHAKAGNQCKHILYVMARVLRARFELVYQLALLSTELVEIFANAPPIEVGEDAEAPKEDKNRKAIEGDCPICFMPFEGADVTVYCRATCGQNIHKECFEMWAATKRKSPNASSKVTCPMCRSIWQGDEDMVKKITNTGKLGSDGYVNVADQLGISRIRDMSTYYTGRRRWGFRRNW